ncbi:MAG: hypothetical protein WD827_01335 [Solirubrobacterales bacterium]
MGILNARPKLEPGEELRWKALANHVDGPSYVLWGMTSSSSGQLVVTDRRVFYQPSRVDTLFRQKRWECPLDAAMGVEIVSRASREGIDMFAGELRDRLGIRTEDGVEVFVVNRLEEKMVELQRLFL